MLDAYAELFNDHHQAEDKYFFPALHRAEPALDAVVDRLAAQHEELAGQLAVVWEGAHRLQSGDAEHDDIARLVDVLLELQGNVDEHLVFEETATVPVVRTWTTWPV